MHSGPILNNPLTENPNPLKSLTDSALSTVDTPPPKVAFRPQPVPSGLETPPRPATLRPQKETPMTRETTLSLIRRYYDAFNAGDPEGMLACLTDDVEHRVNEGGHRIGRRSSASSAATWGSATASS
jgi:hypothetical protein